MRLISHNSNTVTLLFIILKYFHKSKNYELSHMGNAVGKYMKLVCFLPVSVAGASTKNTRTRLPLTFTAFIRMNQLGQQLVLLLH